MDSRAALTDRLDAALPQTQCRRCGYDDCRHYAQAVAAGAAAVNRCPPGGAEGIARLAAIMGTVPILLDTTCGVEGPLRHARIEEDTCIGCTLCLAVCPVDCIVGGPKSLHTVVEPLCTGCELCLPVCPVDCIVMNVVSGDQTGWNAWSKSQADHARARYAVHQLRMNGTNVEPHAHHEAASAVVDVDDSSRAVSLAAAAAARARRGRRA